MTLTVDQLHQRYYEQSRWTASLRDFLFAQADLAQDKKVLEVGCGTGVITRSLSKETIVKIGLDLSLDCVEFASDYDHTTDFINSDAAQIPFQSNFFDITFCHYFLLWLHQPVNILKEMVRATKPGGKIIALAEPDFAARIDYPDELVPLGQLQTQSLYKQGANISSGRHLPEWFSKAGLKEIQFGASGFQGNIGHPPVWISSEWETLQTDINFLSPDFRLADFEEVDHASWQNGSRVLWIPTFYAIGTVA